MAFSFSQIFKSTPEPLLLKDVSGFQNYCGLAVLLKLRKLDSRVPRNSYQLTSQWRQQLHHYPDFLEEKPGDYSYFISKYSNLVSRIRKAPHVAYYLTEKEITRHCLKNFLSSKTTKPVAKVLERRGLYYKSFDEFEAMKKELFSSIERSEQKREWLIKRHQKRAYVTESREPEISDADLVVLKEKARQLRIKKRQQSVLTTGVRDGELFCERVPVNPENISANEIQPECVANSELSSKIASIKAKDEKQPLIPYDSVSQTDGVQTKKSSIVSIAITALSAAVTAIIEYSAESFLDQLDWIDSFFQSSKTYDAISAVDDATTSSNADFNCEEIQLGGASLDETSDTICNGATKYRSNSLLDELDWLDSVCIRFTPLATAHV
ncbi:unnamed protein product [Ambrosiozyma monospora]|uniref:Unnamed protein product n=1 Tax=Ambrosiozyma monospora TaxID=43982 RepID=A0ACB5T2V2_AMBMO|nr:unnamed protein product [Ambrosiozyma monospora]